MKVLIIEDEPMTRLKLRKMLKTIQIESFQPQSIIEVEYAEDAIPYLKKTQFDIIFTDIEGGEMNGLALIEGWRGQQAQAQWIIISGYDRFEFAQQAISYGVKEYLLKPITRQTLRDTIVSCIEGLKENESDYIGANEIEKILQQLEQSIWNLDEQEVFYLFGQWQASLEAKSISVKYYCNILSHLMEVLFQRIKTKGSQLIQAFQWEINSSSKSVANQIFLAKCREIIKMLEQKRRGNEIDPIQTAKDFIAKNIETEISLQEVASKLGLNASYFSQLFKKETGETFVKYRIRLRMERAKELLLRSDIRVIDIPFFIGLNDHPHFTKTFKKYTGETPSEFRKKMGVN
jgi:two-component system, response regulator YesN